MAENIETGFVDHVVSIRRVTKVTKGGKRFNFAAFVVTGDKRGKVGIGVGKGREVSVAILKATNKARKSLINIAMRGSTIPYDVQGRHGASFVVLRPAYKGSGKKAGGAVRAILDAAGIDDALSKSIGSKNSMNVAKATLNALSKLRTANELAKLRGLNVKQMVKGS